MKLKSKLVIGLIALGVSITNIAAQSVPPSPPASPGGVTAPNFINVPISYKGQTFLITSNPDGSYNVSTYGVDGTNVITGPVTPDQAMQIATAWVAGNNPGNIGYYGTNEITARIGAAYLQNSGQAVAFIAVDKYGWFSQNIGFGAGVLEGNNGGKSGTAGEYGEVVYRKPIGDVAWIGGALAGYDNWNKKPFFGAKVGLEYRRNNNLGAFLDAIECYESGNGSRGLILATGVTYAFK